MTDAPTQHPGPYSADAVWRTRDGKELLLSEMTTDHLEAAIAMLESVSAAGLNESAAPWIERMKAELASRKPK
jgi:hypothetical protein